jgi:hypothetical protein
VLDSKIAANIFRRWGLEIMANPYADSAFEYNQIHYRAETRFALGAHCDSSCVFNGGGGAIDQVKSARAR